MHESFHICRTCGQFSFSPNPCTCWFPPKTGEEAMQELLEHTQRLLRETRADLRYAQLRAQMAEIRQKVGEEQYANLFALMTERKPAPVLTIVAKQEVP